MFRRHHVDSTAVGGRLREAAIEARTTLEADPAGAKAARRFVLERLRAWRCEHVADAVACSRASS
jgi:hypothetical protein